MIVCRNENSDQQTLIWFPRVAWEPSADALRPVTLTVDFMREGTPVDTHAAAEITRLGRRIANVAARAWQFERARPIAAANINFLIDWPERAADR